MNEYVSRENGCRSEILLQYFGEKNSMPCLRCDLCLQKHDSGLSESVYKVIRDDVKKLLKNSPAEPAELYRLPYGKEQLNIALRHMLNEEILCMKYEMVYLQKSDD
jgi:ATP-dependent DNA helicase RecQ